MLSSVAFSIASSISAAREDFVDHLTNRVRCINPDRSAGHILLGLVQSQDQSLLRRPSAPLVPWSGGQSLLQRVPVNFEDEYLVEHVDETSEISRAATEKGFAVSSVSRNRADKINVPDMVLMRQARQRLSGLRTALISQFAIPVDRVIAAALQFVADRGLSRSRDAFDQVVSNSHESVRFAVKIRERCQLITLQTAADLQLAEAWVKKSYSASRVMFEHRHDDAVRPTEAILERILTAAPGNAFHHVVLFGEPARLSIYFLDSPEKADKDRVG